MFVSLRGFLFLDLISDVVAISFFLPWGREIKEEDENLWEKNERGVGREKISRVWTPMVLLPFWLVGSINFELKLSFKVKTKLNIWAKQIVEWVKKKIENKVWNIS